MEIQKRQDEELAAAHRGPDEKATRESEPEIMADTQRDLTLEKADIESQAGQTNQLLVLSAGSPPTPSSPISSDYTEGEQQLRFGCSSASSEAEEEEERAMKRQSELGHEQSGEESRPDSVSSLSISSSTYEELNGQQVSELNLRQLKMRTMEDVMVCGESRRSTESARRLFSALTCGCQTATVQETNTATRRRCGSSLSSRSSRAEKDSDEAGDELERGVNQVESHSELYLSEHTHNLGRPEYRIPDYDYGTIKLTRRPGCHSAASNTSSSCSSSNFGRTLVCSVSPVSGIVTRDRFASSTGSSRPSNGEDAASLLEYLEDGDYYYSVDGDEIRQCRAAFRENRRLIEQAQALALGHMAKTNEHRQLCANADDRSGLGPGLSRALSQATLQSDLTNRSQWVDSLSRRKRLPSCARCHGQLYPMDRMELDFTRTRLNLHRNCFRCQICSTLLRLETYSSIDAKLYCPAHTRFAVETMSSVLQSTPISGSRE